MMRGSRWLIAALGLVVLSGCALQVPMNTQMPALGIDNQVPLRAALVIPESLRDEPYRGTPQSFTGSGREHVFPIGREIEKAARDAFSQVFHELDVVRRSPDPQAVEVVIEPTLDSFHFRYDQLSYAGFAVAAVSRIRVTVRLTDGIETVWTRTVETPDQRRGPWVMDFNFEERVGDAASDALVAAFKDIALEAARASEVWGLADRVRTERGPLTARPERR